MELNVTMDAYASDVRIWKICAFWGRFWLFLALGRGDGIMDVTAGFYSEHASDIHFDSMLYLFLLMKSIGKSFYL